DALFAKTDITIGQSLTLLNNEITKFVGEAGKGSGAAQVLAGTIQTLAGNLDVLTSAMMVGGAYWLGTYIPAIYASGVAVAAKIKELAAQTVTQYAAIQAERAAAAQEVASMQAKLASIQATRAQIVEELKLELRRMKTQISTQGAINSELRMGILRQQQAKINAELTATENALATAQARSAAAGAASVGIGSRLLGLLGGPVGMGITVASLAAGYLLMRDNGDKANDMLEKQSRYAGMAADELMKLEGAQKRAAEGELTKQLSLQNAQLSKSQNEFLLLTQSITDSNKQSAEAYRIWAELKTGVIDVNQAFNRLNQLSFISSDQINQLADSKKKVDENTKAVKQTNSELNQVRTSGANAKAGFNDVSQGAKGAGQDVSELNKKLQDLQKTYAQKNLDTDFSLINIKSHGLEMGKALSDFYDNNKIPKTRSLTKDEWAIFQKNFDKVQELKKLEEDIADSKRQQTKESEKKLKITQAELEVAKRSAALIESSGLGKYAESKGIPSSVIAGLLAQESKGIREAKSHTGAIGYFQTTSGYRKQNNMSVADSYDLEKSGKIVIDNIAKVYEKTGDLAQAILSHNAGEGGARQFTKTGKVKGSAERNKEVSQYVAKVSRYSDIIAGGVGKGGLSDGDSDRAYGEQIKARLELVKQGLNLQEQYEEEQAKRTKARNEEINLAQQTGQTALIPKIKERYKAQDELAKLQQDFEVNGYKWTEEQKLDYTYKTNSLRLVAEGKLSEDQRKVALDGLEQQKQQELGLLKLAQEQRLFQARLSLLSETQAMQERYRLEREEILKNTKLSIEERQKLIALSKANQDKETRDKVNNAVQNWGGIQADMNGTGEFFRQDRERFSRLNAANDLADSQFAATDLNEQNSLDGLNAQFEAGLIKQQDYENQKTAIIQAAQDQRNQIAAEYAQNAQDIEDKYHQDRLNAQIALGGQMMGSLTSMFGSMFGEQSKAYKIMFAADKAYAIAAAGIAIQQNIAAASKVGFPLNLPLIAGAVAQGASIIANIRAIKDQGFADGGYTGRGGKYEVAGAVHKGEIVWSQEDIKRWGGVGLVEKMRKSANPEAFLNNNASADSVMRRALMSSNAFIESQKQADIFNQPVQDT
ncbi:transglycosylase SLT domain-containing protein, partial [Acinetobacter baumannii]|uniref:transglycosylase SLT domain-containing protein n=1 Tax=Acinetobacter baumannii TaxID=470 RepID=UPI000CE4F8B5